MQRVTYNLSLPAYAVRILSVLEAAGYEAWCVGGWVRDALLQRTAYDLDITTNALPNQVSDICVAAGLKVIPTGLKHGTLTIGVDGHLVEVTTYRSDGSYGDGRHPDTVCMGASLEEDLARRDFTINALAYHPQKGVKDLFGGISDLEAQKIRAVGDPALRFQEDYLRILRALRFSSQLGFSIEDQTEAALFTYAGRLSRLSVERVANELDGILCGCNVLSILMNYIEVLGVVLPELLPMRNFDQHTPYHCYDVLEHTAHVVMHVRPTSLMRWAALLHDVGKPSCFSQDETGRGHFYGHPLKSKEMSIALLKRLHKSTAFISDLCFLVEFHDEDIEPTPLAIKQLLRQIDGRSDLVYDLCELKRADTKGQSSLALERFELANEVERMLDEVLAQKAAYCLKDLKLSGDDVVELGLEPGPQIGELLNAALDAVITGEQENTHENLRVFAKAWIKEHSAF